MQAIPWSNELKLGVSAIDASNKEMVKIANQFINAASRRTPTVMLARLLTRLRERAVNYIETKEKLMAQARYSHRSRYSLENQRFKIALQRFQKHLQIAGKPDVEDVRHFRASLLNHIKDSNLALASIAPPTDMPQSGRIN